MGEVSLRFAAIPCLAFLARNGENRFSIGRRERDVDRSLPKSVGSVADRLHGNIVAILKTGDQIMSRASLKNTAHADEIFDVFGPRIQFLTALSENDDDYCLIQGTVPAGVIVPLHSHGERETFYVVAGEIQGLCEDRWITFGVGDVFDVPGGLKHAWRNVSGASVSLLFAMPMRLGRFFRDIGRPVAMASQDAPKPADFQRLFEIATTYGYWLGSPADNAAVGLSVG
jgi:quercetin dioxygenase-like cupin family protein